jgi:hypothetical protein
MQRVWFGWGPARTEPLPDVILVAILPVLVAANHLLIRYLYSAGLAGHPGSSLQLELRTDGLLQRKLQCYGWRSWLERVGKPKPQELCYINDLGGIQGFLRIICPAFSVYIHALPFSVDLT